MAYAERPQKRNIVKIRLVSLLCIRWRVKEILWSTVWRLDRLGRDLLFYIQAQWLLAQRLDLSLRARATTTRKTNSSRVIYERPLPLMPNNLIKSAPLQPGDRFTQPIGNLSHLRTKSIKKRVGKKKSTNNCTRNMLFIYPEWLSSYSSQFICLPRAFHKPMHLMTLNSIFMYVSCCELWSAWR